MHREIVKRLILRFWGRGGDHEFRNCGCGIVLSTQSKTKKILCMKETGRFKIQPCDVLGNPTRHRLARVSGSLLTILKLQHFGKGC